MQLTGFRWRSLVDEELGLAFSVAPWTGSLLAGARSGEGVGPLPRWLGFDPARRGAPDDFARSDDILDADPSDRHLSGDVRRIATRRASWAYRWAFRVPLTMLVLAAAVDSRRRRTAADVPRIADPVEACGAAAALFGTRSGGDCLPMSICRYWFLRCVGHAPHLHVGVFVPTDTMHAWVQLADRAVLESADELVHYQSCVVYGDA